MQDRRPGAPGRYKATLTAAEFLKMQAGEQFTITMVRDDQPIVEGTPYSKAAVLPDNLAAIICPDVLNPTPADALGALLPRNGKAAMTANLPMGGFKVTGLGTPSESGDAVPLGYANKNFAPARVLLWENASPTSTFPAQTIDLELSKYSFIEILFSGSVSADGNTAVHKLQVGRGCALISLSGATGDSPYITMRSLVCTKTSVTFYDGGYFYLNNGAKVVDNDRNIPLAIYGIEGVA